FKLSREKLPTEYPIEIVKKIYADRFMNLSAVLALNAILACITGLVIIFISHPLAFIIIFFGLLLISPIAVKPDSKSLKLIKRALTGKLYLRSRLIIEELRSTTKLIWSSVSPGKKALGLAIGVFLIYLISWLCANDMKVSRALLIYLLGDRTSFTRNLLTSDPKLPYYRIITYDAYQLAISTSLYIIPLSVLSFYIARKTLTVSSTLLASGRDRRHSIVAMVLSTILFMTFSTHTIVSVPSLLTYARDKKSAATRAKMYEIHCDALERFRKEFGVYPGDLSDITRVNAGALDPTDAWENSFSYSPHATLAGRGNFGFELYVLVSAGPDQKFGTKDDICMTDGVVVDCQKLDGQGSMKESTPLLPRP
ncbi:MAG: hypothetical protein ABI977_22030, partial [Acidobacteriota bacterium]